MQELRTFPDSEVGLTLAWETSLSLRRAGFKTRLATRQWGPTTVHTVVAEPPKRSNRKLRGAEL
jgi:hypothetical protein